MKGFLTWIVAEPDDLEYGMAEYLTAIRDDVEPTTLRRKLTAFRTWARWAGHHDGFLSDYTAPRPAPARPHPLPGGMEDVRRMLDGAAADVELQALVCLQGMMGLRVGEALAVAASDVDFCDLVVKVHGKGRRDRWVPIPEIGVPYLVGAWTKAGPGTKNPLIPMADTTARGKITKLGRRVRIDGVSSHDLRATFATHVYGQTKDLRAVQDLLGHSDPKTTLVYTDRDLATLRGAVATVAAPADA